MFPLIYNGVQRLVLMLSRAFFFLPFKRRAVERIVARFSPISTMAPTAWVPNTYPKVRRSDHVDIFKSASRGQVLVKDNYQWLEKYTEETDKFTNEQNDLTRSYLDQNPNLMRLEDALKKCNDYAKYYTPEFREDGRWYWFYNSGLDPQTAFYRSQTSTLPDPSTVTDSGGEIFFDPNALSEDGTASLSSYAFSNCGQYFAYGISYSGSDFMNVFIRRTNSPFTKDVDIKNDCGRFPEEIKFVKFTDISWTPDSKGFFYQRYPDTSLTGQEQGPIATEGDLDAMVYYHRLGTHQCQDILILQDKENRERMFHMDVSKDGKYVILHVIKDSSRQNMLWVAELDCENIGPDFKWKKIIDEWGSEFECVANKGPVFYLRTNESAPRYKLISIDISKDNEKKEVIPQSDATFSSIARANNDYFTVVYKRNVKDELYIYDFEGKEIARLAEDFVGSLYPSPRHNQPWFFVTLSGFTTPGTAAKYDFREPEDKRWSIYRTLKMNGLRVEDFETRQVWYESKDGTPIPMFVTRHKDTPFDGTAPALQYGYGGFAISVDPFFSATILTFIQHYGMIFVVPSIRGGSEFGEAWHEAGCRDKKSNCFDDFIAATKFLIKNKYAAPGKVVINGGSNGGLLVSACVNRAPEGTFGCAISEVGVHDLLKFHRFTIGKAWTSDYGDPDDPNDFDFIFPISPLHNIPKNKVFPPTLLLTADHDDRVVPAHTFKFAAELQHSLPQNPNPLLLRVDKDAGHGAGKSFQKKLKEHADKWGFAAQSMGLVWKDIPGKPSP